MKPKVNGNPSALLPSTGLRCAIYARKSTDDSARTEDNRSTTRQVEHAKQFAKSKGWTVDDQYCYVDDNVSGSEFERRPGFARLLADLPKKGTAPFDVLVMSEDNVRGTSQIHMRSHPVLDGWAP